MKKIISYSVIIVIVLSLLLMNIGTAAAAPREDKVSVCHVPPGNPSNAHWITVGATAAEGAHQPASPETHPGHPGLGDPRCGCCIS
jgi:hypothetical protein